MRDKTIKIILMAAGIILVVAAAIILVGTSIRNCSLGRRDSARADRLAERNSELEEAAAVFARLFQSNLEARNRAEFAARRGVAAIRRAGEAARQLTEENRLLAVTNIDLTAIVGSLAEGAGSIAGLAESGAAAIRKSLESLQRLQEGSYEPDR